MPCQNMRVSSSTCHRRLPRSRIASAAATPATAGGALPWRSSQRRRSPLGGTNKNKIAGVPFSIPPTRRDPKTCPSQSTLPNSRPSAATTGATPPRTTSWADKELRAVPRNCSRGVTASAQAAHVAIVDGAAAMDTAPAAAEWTERVGRCLPLTVI